MRVDNVNAPSARQRHNEVRISTAHEHAEMTDEAVRELTIVFYDCAKPMVDIDQGIVRLQWYCETKDGEVTLIAEGATPASWRSGAQYQAWLHKAGQVTELGELTLNELRSHVPKASNGFRPQGWHASAFQRECGPWTVIVEPAMEPEEGTQCIVSSNGIPVHITSIVKERWQNVLQEAESTLQQVILDQRETRKAYDIGKTVITEREK